MNNVEALQIFQRSVKLFNKSSRSFLVNGADSEEHSEFDRLVTDWMFSLASTSTSLEASFSTSWNASLCCLNSLALALKSPELFSIVSFEFSSLELELIPVEFSFPSFFSLCLLFFSAFLFFFSSASFSILNLFRFSSSIWTRCLSFSNCSWLVFILCLLVVSATERMLFSLFRS